MDSTEVAEQMAGDDVVHPQEPQPDMCLPDEIHLDGSGSDMDGDGEGNLAEERSAELDTNDASDVMDAREFLRQHAIHKRNAAVSVVSGRAYRQVH